MAVKTKSIYEPAAAEDAVRVLITRFYPRGVKKDRFDIRVKALSPSKKLLASYRAGEKGWDEFRKSFLSELASSEEASDAISEVRELARRRGVTLLCYEKEGAPCHRHIVKEVLGRAQPQTRPEHSAPFISHEEHFYSRRKVGRKVPS